MADQAQDVELKPFVSIIIPCRNEEKFLNNCLQSVLKQDYPKARMEVIIVDGMSTDKTWGIADYYREVYGMKVMVNPKKLKAPGLNMAVKESKGERVMILDAHSRYPQEYISELMKHDEDNVGGMHREVPRGTSFLAKAIILAKSVVFGVCRGN